MLALRRASALFILVSALAACGGSNASVITDHDPEASFDQYRTFDLLDEGSGLSGPLSPSVTAPAASRVTASTTTKACSSRVMEFYKVEEIHRAAAPIGDELRRRLEQFSRVKF